MLISDLTWKARISHSFSGHGVGQVLYGLSPSFSHQKEEYAAHLKEVLGKSERWFAVSLGVNGIDNRVYTSALTGSVYREMKIPCGYSSLGIHGCRVPSRITGGPQLVEEMPWSSVLSLVMTGASWLFVSLCDPSLLGGCKASQL